MHRKWGGYLVVCNVLVHCHLPVLPTGICVTKQFSSWPRGKSNSLRWYSHAAYSQKRERMRERETEMETDTDRQIDRQIESKLYEAPGSRPSSL